MIRAKSEGDEVDFKIVDIARVELRWSLGSVLRWFQYKCLSLLALMCSINPRRVRWCQKTGCADLLCL